MEAKKENQLKKMAQFNKKHQKGWGWFCYPSSSVNVKQDAGNVPYNNSVFNDGMGISAEGGASEGPALGEDLIQSSSDKAFEQNVKTELKAGKPKKQALAIAYSIKEKNRMKEGILEAMETKKYFTVFNHFDPEYLFFVKDTEENMNKVYGDTDYIYDEIEDFTPGLYLITHNDEYSYSTKLEGNDEEDFYKILKDKVKEQLPYDAKESYYEIPILEWSVEDDDMYPIENAEDVVDYVRNRIEDSYVDNDSSSAIEFYKLTEEDFDEANLEEEEEEITESIDPSKAKELRNKSDAYAILYGYKFLTNKETPVEPEEHTEESLRKRIDEIVKSYNGKGRRPSKEAKEEDFIFYVLYPTHKDINESKGEDFKAALRNAIHNYYKEDRDYSDEDFDDMIGDYLTIRIKPYTNSRGDWGTYVLVGAELSYSGFERLIEECLDPFIVKYDADAYFEMEDPGLASTILWNKNLVEGCTESLTEGAMSELDIEIQDEGGLDNYIEKLESRLKDLTDYRDYLDTTAEREAGRGGNFDSLDDVREAKEEIEDEIRYINNKLSVVRRAK